MRHNHITRLTLVVHVQTLQNTPCHLFCTCKGTMPFLNKSIIRSLTHTDKRGEVQNLPLKKTM